MIVRTTSLKKARGTIKSVSREVILHLVEELGELLTGFFPDPSLQEHALCSFLLQLNLQLLQLGRHPLRNKTTQREQWRKKNLINCN